MKTARLHHRSRRPGGVHGFTLLEVLMAMFVFVVAAISLVECINNIGLASAETRLERRVQSRLDSLLVDVTRRSPWLERRSAAASEWMEELTEEAVQYQIKASPLALKTDEGALLDGVYGVVIRAQWREDGRMNEASAETWVWPQIFSPSP